MDELTQEWDEIANQLLQGNFDNAMKAGEYILHLHEKIQSQAEEIKKLKDARDIHVDFIGQYQAEVSTLLDDKRSLQIENQRLMEIAQYYADDDNWMRDIPTSNKIGDGGKCARRILEALAGDK